MMNGFGDEALESGGVGGNEAILNSQAQFIICRDEYVTSQTSN